jgi:O-methyltransferase involved in polyketide biosynthesis
LMYIQANDVFQLVNRLTTHLQAGEIAFDIFTRLGTRIIQRHSSLRVTRATLVWSMEDPRELERQAPKLKFAAEYTPYDTGQVKRMSWPARATIRLFLAIPPLRRMARVLLYRF